MRQSQGSRNSPTPATTTTTTTNPTPTTGDTWREAAGSMEVVFRSDRSNHTLLGQLVLENVHLAREDRTPPPEEPYDNRGATMYAVAVILVYGFSIVLLIASHTYMKRKVDKREGDDQSTVDKYLDQVPHLQELSKRDSFRKLKMSIMPLVSIGIGRDITTALGPNSPTSATCGKAVRFSTKSNAEWGAAKKASATTPLLSPLPNNPGGGIREGVRQKGQDPTLAEVEVVMVEDSVAVGAMAASTGKGGSLLVEGAAGLSGNERRRTPLSATTVHEETPGLCRTQESSWSGQNAPRAVVTSVVTRQLSASSSGPIMSEETDITSPLSTSMSSGVAYDCRLQPFCDQPWSMDDRTATAGQPEVTLFSTTSPMLHPSRSIQPSVHQQGSLVATGVQPPGGMIRQWARAPALLELHVLPQDDTVGRRGSGSPGIPGEDVDDNLIPIQITCV